MSSALSPPITTRFTQPVAAFADLEALARLPYDSLVIDRNLVHVFEATALAERLTPLPRTYRIETRSS